MCHKHYSGIWPSYYLLISLESILHLPWSSVRQILYNRKTNINLKSGIKPSLLLEEVSLERFWTASNHLMGQ